MPDVITTAALLYTLIRNNIKYCPGKYIARKYQSLFAGIMYRGDSGSIQPDSR